MKLYRRAWTMQLRDGAGPEYDAAHAAIWPELTDHMIASGIRTFHLFRDGLTILPCRNAQGRSPRLTRRQAELTQKWWNSMARLMVTDSSGRPIQRDLTQVFDLEEATSRMESTK